MEIDIQNLQESQQVLQKLELHFQNRKKIKEMYQNKGVQMLDKDELLVSDIEEPNLGIGQASIYENMKRELTEKGYSDFRFLGQGLQGLVMLAKDSKSNIRYAIKGVQVRDDKGKVYDEVQNLVKNEIDILQNCRGSPYVVSLLGSFEGKLFTYLVLSECQGTLTEIITKSQNKRLNEISAIKYAKDITEGIYYIHSKGYLANDLKMENILIDYNGNAVVSDFGLAAKLTVKSEYSEDEYMGNFYYQAPECYGPNDNIGKVYYDEYKKQDVQVQQLPSIRSEAFYLGYLIYSLVQGIDLKLIFSKHQPLDYKEFQNFGYHKQLQYLINELTQFVPRKRLPIFEALIVLKGIICIEFQLDDMFIDMIDGNTQQFTSSLKNEIEFVEDFPNKFYPIVQQKFFQFTAFSNYFQSKNEQSLLQELQELKEDIQKKVYDAKKEQQEKVSQLEVNIKFLLDESQQAYTQLIKKQISDDDDEYGQYSSFIKQTVIEKI
ncbi:kinase domain protein (macronuclear) [Tetrahymena thermophila SB210]|uniref:Kinase domain protein n=1 Tax=Tetrahymena thermophila (strain SB210) TaxID=312017 RepID=Q23BJ8_TETTS|nr:kinase domain protein [Tetrahymena thermophila SB210]EAR94120.2 kinase domain protein [Tetrahymena thermophila SB210]|eukprot:XP_001014365.2 kinase domain protein [Tetrahymena thermophila SB210]